MRHKVVTISNSCDLNVFRADPVRRTAVRAAHGVREDQLVVLYTGAMGRSNAVDDIVQLAAQTADDPRIVWWFAGDGAEADKIRRLTSGISRVGGGPGAGLRARAATEPRLSRRFAARWESPPTAPGKSGTGSITGSRPTGLK